MNYNKHTTDGGDVQALMERADAGEALTDEELQRVRQIAPERCPECGGRPQASGFAECQEFHAVTDDTGADDGAGAAGAAGDPAAGEGATDASHPSSDNPPEDAGTARGAGTAGATLHHETYCYVETAFGGPQHRGHLVRHDAVDPPADTPDCYASWWRYPEAAQAHLATHRNDKGRPTLKGYDGPVWTDRMVWDCDSKDDPAKAQTDALAIADALIEHGVPPEAIAIFYSGHKGFHVEAAAAWFGGFTPTPTLPKRLKRLAVALSEELSTVDHRIYSGGRLLRLPNTRHGKTGRYKIPLTVDELRTLSIEAITELATQPRYLPPWEGAPRPLTSLVILWAQTEEPEPDGTQAEPGTVGERELSDGQRTVLVAVLRPHYAPGQRHDLSRCLAGYLAKLGFTEASAIGAVEALFDPAEADPDRQENNRQAVRDTYRLLTENRHRVSGRRGLLELGVPLAVLDTLDSLLTAKGDAAADSPNSPNPPNPPFPIGVLPEPLADYISAVARAAGDPPMPVDFGAVPLLAIAAGMLGHQVELEIKPGWRERVQDWYAVVGRPGSGKSPGLRAAQGLVELLQAEKMARYAERLREWSQQQRPRGEGDRAPRAPKPIPEQYYLSDITFEALAPAPEGAPGLTLVRDELLAFVLSFDAYRKGGDRQRWLELWAGAPIMINRKTSEPVYIGRPVVALVGGIQPDRLPDLRAEAGQQDGFIDRFLFSYPVAHIPRWTDAHVDPTLTGTAQAHMAALRDDLWQAANTIVVRLDDAARDRFRRWYDENADQSAALTGLKAGFAAKAPGHCARLALLLHCLWEPEYLSRPLTVETVERAITLFEYFRTHTHSVYARIGEPIIGAAAVGVGARVLRVLQDAAASGKPWTSRTDLIDKLRTVPTAALEEVLQVLLKERLVERRLVSTTTKPREEWRSI